MKITLLGTTGEEAAHFWLSAGQSRPMPSSVKPKDLKCHL